MQKKNTIFQSIFADAWDKLPPVMHKHYANKPFSHDVVVADGKMDVSFGWFIRLLRPVLKITGALVPYEGQDIPVQVRFTSEPSSKAYCLERVFNFQGRTPYRFFSRMIQIKDAEIIEYMSSGIGWRHSYHYEAEKVMLRHKGYVWKVWGRTISLPISWVLGRGYAEEIAISETMFRMKMTITHPLFGQIYEYRGVFEITGIQI